MTHKYTRCNYLIQRFVKSNRQFLSNEWMMEWGKCIVRWNDDQDRKDNKLHKRTCHIPGDWDLLSIQNSVVSLQQNSNDQSLTEVDEWSDPTRDWMEVFHPIQPQVCFCQPISSLHPQMPNWSSLLQGKCPTSQTSIAQRAVNTWDDWMVSFLKQYRCMVIWMEIKQ